MNLSTRLEKIDKFLKSKKHKFDCASWSEGQSCCLDQGKEGRKFITKLINSELKKQKIELRDKFENSGLQKWGEKGWWKIFKK